MDVRTFRAGSMQEALALVRRELGSEAAVLHTREVQRRGLLGIIPKRRQIEVTASNDVHVPSRVTPPAPATSRIPAPAAAEAAPASPRIDAVQSQLDELQRMVATLTAANSPTPTDTPDAGQLTGEMFTAYTALIDADLDEDVARRLVCELRDSATPDVLRSPDRVRRAVADRLAQRIQIAGPIKTGTDRPRIAALVGPTGVGKTTTIAKLAANYRLRHRHKVGLITVDTYRIAAVEQLRTYAEIIDLPMQVVSTPREMREAIERLKGLELILMDTAGRSPQDDIKIQELKAFLTEADADETHLVLSSTSSSKILNRTVERFLPVGVTSLVLTKLDEAVGLGSLVPLLEKNPLPLSYLTNGQNVPDDIRLADAEELANAVVNMNNNLVPAANAHQPRFAA